MQRIALRRLGLIPHRKTGASKRKELAFRAELASLGYHLEGYDDSLLERHSELISELRGMRGGGVDYVPLFQGFPEQIPEDDAYFVDRLLGYLHRVCFESTPEWLFDLEEFGADPVTQLQTPGLFLAGAERQRQRQQDDQVEWRTLRAVSFEEMETACRKFLLANLYATSSIKEALHQDLFTLLEHFGARSVEPERVVFKETSTLLTTYYWRRGDFTELCRYLRTPTDILRLLAGLTGSDVSLAQPVKFPRMNRGQRRLLLSCLEGYSNLAEDLNRYRGLWLALARYLHPGDYHRRFPRVAETFRQLAEGRIPTFSTRLEQALAQGDLEQALALVESRPGVFGRRLHQLLEMDYVRVLEAFAPVEIPLKNLLLLETHFRTIEDSEFRAIFTKRGNIWVQPNRRGRLTPAAVEAVGDLLRRKIRKQLAARESWEGRRAYVDPAWRWLAVPLQQRKASDGMLTLGRGSRLPLEAGKVLRLFVYWKEAVECTDLDLSVIKFDGRMNYVGHVSYTQLESGGIVHSGDLQSAPHGAVEFIDIELNYLDCRYVASQVYRYCGDSFGQMDCHAGWMIRDRVSSDYQSFDIKTVQHKFDLTGSAGICLPVVVDLERMEVIFTDLYLRGVNQHNNVEGGVNDISTICRQVVRMGDTRPNMKELAEHHLAARGATPVESPAQADLLFGFEGADYDARDLAGAFSALG